MNKNSKIVVVFVILFIVGFILSIISLLEASRSIIIFFIILLITGGMTLFTHLKKAKKQKLEKENEEFNQNNPFFTNVQNKDLSAFDEEDDDATECMTQTLSFYPTTLTLEDIQNNLLEDGFKQNNQGVLYKQVQLDIQDQRQEEHFYIRIQSGENTYSLVNETNVFLQDLTEQTQFEQSFSYIVVFSLPIITRQEINLVWNGIELVENLYPYDFNSSVMFVFYEQATSRYLFYPEVLDANSKLETYQPFIENKILKISPTEYINLPALTQEEQQLVQRIKTSSRINPIFSTLNQITTECITESLAESECVISSQSENSDHTHMINANNLNHDKDINQIKNTETDTNNNSLNQYSNSDLNDIENPQNTDNAFGFDSTTLNSTDEQPNTTTESYISKRDEVFPDFIFDSPKLNESNIDLCIPKPNEKSTDLHNSASIPSFSEIYSIMNRVAPTLNDGEVQILVQNSQNLIFEPINFDNQRLTHDYALLLYKNGKRVLSINLVLDRSTALYPIKDIDSLSYTFPHNKDLSNKEQEYVKERLLVYLNGHNIPYTLC